MAKKARKKSKARKVKRAARKPARRSKPARAKMRRAKAPARPASAFQVMIDTINETERMRAKAEPHDSD